MTSYCTSKNSPIPIRIDGKDYLLPRFLRKRLSEWVAKQEDERLTVMLARAKGDQEQEARILGFYQSVPADIALLIQQATTPDGAAYIVKTCCVAANVPEDVATDLVEEMQPMELRGLALQLLSGNRAVANMKRDSGEPTPKGKEPPDPTPGSSPTSAGEPSTTPLNSPSSTAVIQDSTPTNSPSTVTTTTSPA